MEAKFLLLVGLAAVALGAASVVWAEDQMDAATKARVEKFEQGPATVNVSKYPSAIQADYQVFSQKCAQCHKLSRPINSDFVLPSEWSRYIKRMMYKPGSGIAGGDAKSIYDFLVYDSSVRKKSQLDAKLKSLAPADSAAEEKKIKEVVDAAK
jgi:cytochrome c5